MLFQNFLATQLCQAPPQPWLPLSTSGDFLVSLLPQAPGCTKPAEVVSFRAGGVTNQLQGGRFAEAKCVWAKSISSPKPQDIAILILVVFSWSPRLSWGGRRESRKKRFLCALEAGLPLSLSLSALVFLRRVL